MKDIRLMFQIISIEDRLIMFNSNIILLIRMRREIQLLLMVLRIHLFIILLLMRVDLLWDLGRDLLLNNQFNS